MYVLYDVHCTKHQRSCIIPFSIVSVCLSTYLSVCVRVLWVSVSKVVATAVAGVRNVHTFHFIISMCACVCVNKCAPTYTHVHNTEIVSLRYTHIYICMYGNKMLFVSMPFTKFNSKQLNYQRTNCE